MPTLPARPPDSGSEPHQQRQVAESFGADAGRYDRTRPSYPADLVDRIVAESPGHDVLDVGCGTGIATRQFQAAGCQVLGIDADARMAELARQNGFAVEVAMFEDWRSGGREFDAVIAAQSWHWVDPVAGAAKAAQVLRPGGRLALFWNVSQLPAGLAEAFSAVYREVLPDKPVYHRAVPGLVLYSGTFSKAADGMRQAGGFGESEQWQFAWERCYPRAEWLDQLATFGGHSQLPPATLAELQAGIGAAIDGVGGSFTMEYVAVVVTGVRLGRP
jgi:SAM-dependent methyltransferase